MRPSARHPFDLPACLARARASLARFRRDTRGGVAAMVALMSPVLIGGMGLGAETGYWYLTQRKVQNAADVAAHAGAIRLRDGGGGATLQQVADFIVGQSDVNIAMSTVNLSNPPASGGYAGDASAVEVTVTRTVPRMFSRIYDTADVLISGRAVALVGAEGRGCVIALSSVEASAITVTGSGSINLQACDFVSNGNGISFEMSGAGSVVSANCIQTADSAVITNNLTVVCTDLRENAGIFADPLAGLDEPAVTGVCMNGNVGQNNQTTQVTAVEAHASGMASMRFCTGLNLRGTVDFDPGLYIVEGGLFTINSNATVTGDGVMFYLRDGVELRFNGTATITLAAPTSGDYAGVLFFGSRDATTMSHIVNGNFGSRLDGAIYAAGSHIDVQGNATTSFSACTQIVSDTITFSGDGAVNLHCDNPWGDQIVIPGRITLVE